MVAMDHGPGFKVALFMATMVVMNLAQLINGPTYPGSHTLNLMFASGYWHHDLDLEDIFIEGTFSLWP